MTIAWMLYVLFVGTLLSGAALSIDGVVRRTSLPTRWVWVAALAGIVAFALLAPRRENAPLPTSLDAEIALTTTVSKLGPTASIASAFLRAQRRVNASLTEAFIAAETRIPKSVSLAIFGAWGAWSASLLDVRIEDLRQAMNY